MKEATSFLTTIVQNDTNDKSLRLNCAVSLEKITGEHEKYLNMRNKIRGK